MTSATLRSRSMVTSIHTISQISKRTFQNHPHHLKLIPTTFNRTNLTRLSLNLTQSSPFSSSPNAKGAPRSPRVKSSQSLTHGTKTYTDHLARTRDEDTRLNSIALAEQERRLDQEQAEARIAEAQRKCEAIKEAYRATGRSMAWFMFRVNALLFYSNMKYSLRKDWLIWLLLAWGAFAAAVQQAVGLGYLVT